MQPIVAIAAEPDLPALRAKAEALAAKLGLPLEDEAPRRYPLLLVITEKRLELRATSADRPGPIYAEFVAGKMGYRRRAGGSAGKPLLAKAVGLKGKPLTICDTTAGLGRDAFVLASLGCNVTAIERSPLMAALLQDGLDRAAAVRELAKTVRERMRLIVADARDYLAQLAPDERPDAICIDPMFPPKDKTALAKKEMRICRMAAGDDPDAADLLTAALQIPRARVVVKRSLRAPLLGPPPTITYKGTTIRYDVYLPRE